MLNIGTENRARKITSNSASKRFQKLVIEGKRALVQLLPSPRVRSKSISVTGSTTMFGLFCSLSN